MEPSFNITPKELTMKPIAAIAEVPVSRPNIALLMALCGIISAAAAGAVSAAPLDDEVPRLVVKYERDSLATEGGAKVLYHRIVRAAEQVCPATAADRPFLTTAVRQCREQAVARAVQKIDSPRLAAVYAASAGTG
jgi:UrcA family protein